MLHAIAAILSLLLLAGMFSASPAPADDTSSESTQNDETTQENIEHHV